MKNELTAYPLPEYAVFLIGDPEVDRLLAACCSALAFARTFADRYVFFASCRPARKIYSNHWFHACLPARHITNWPHIHYLNMRSILLDGIVHWNPLLFCFNFVAAAFVSSSGHLIGMYHTILFHTRPRFLLHNDWSKIFHASFWNPLSRSIITLYFHIFLWLPARIISSEFTSCMTSYIKRVFLQNWFRFVFPYIYH